MMEESSLLLQSLSVLNNFDRTRNIYVGYSGGVDSHVLLHLIVTNREDLKEKLTAVHVNHGLHIASESWAEHCRKECGKIEVNFKLISLDANAPPGESQEAWARQLRYDAIKKQFLQDDILITAHHKGDMAETLLLQLFRGAGPAGLSAMPQKSRLGAGWHVRPFLNITQRQIDIYAEENGLQWITDDSNLDERFDRNFLRHRVMPVITSRWSGIEKTLFRAATIQSNVNKLLDDLAIIDLESCHNPGNNTLRTNYIKSLSAERATNLIRCWLKKQGHRSPGASVLNQILQDVIHSGQEAFPCVGWDDIEVRRYRDMLFITKNLPKNPPIDREIPWDIDQTCELEIGKLIADKNIGTGIALKKTVDKNISVRFRHGNEQIKQRGHHHKLKHVFQEKGVPPCYRDFIPLIYVDGTLAEVTGLCINEDFAAKPDEEAFRVLWTSAEEIYTLNHIT